MDDLPGWVVIGWGLLMAGGLFSIGAKLDEIIRLLRQRDK